MPDKFLCFFKLRLQASNIKLISFAFRSVERCGSQPREPGIKNFVRGERKGNVLILPIKNNCFDHSMYVAFWSCEFSGILDSYQHHKIQILPHVVLSFDMLFEANCPVIERGPIEAANKAGAFENQLFLLFLRSQVSKSVDDDTKNKIQNNNDNNEEEQKIVDDSRHKKWLSA